MQLFNNYTVLKQIGEGGMARVFLATHNSLKHQVAIKILNKEFVYNTNIRSRFIEEARRMVQMSHPNVVNVSDLIEEENSVAIVMEYVEGQTLKEILEEKKLNDHEIKNYLLQMLQALTYIHNQSLIHRDIKPSNFILSKDGNLKLTDFGISKDLQEGTNEYTQTNTALSMGTPMYMSPEQVTSVKNITKLTDIYSLGVILWQLVSGKKPYNSEITSAFNIQLKIVQEVLPLTNTHWDKTIQKATQKEEEKRFQSAYEFLMDLDEGNIIEEDKKQKIYREKMILKSKVKEIKIENNKKEDKLKTAIIFSLIGIVFIFLFLFFYNNSQEKKYIQKAEKKIKLSP